VTGAVAPSQANGGSTAPTGRRRSTKVTEAEAVASAERAAKRNSTLKHLDRPDVTEIPYTRLGQTIFFAVLGLTSAMFLTLAILAVITYPSAADVHAVVGTTSSPDAALEAWQSMKSQWLDQVMGMGQLLIFGSVLPLLATVVGYLLGERRRNAQGQYHLEGSRTTISRITQQRVSAVTVAGGYMSQPVIVPQ
jgi:hypothetical protein